MLQSLNYLFPQVSSHSFGVVLRISTKNIHKFHVVDSGKASPRELLIIKFNRLYRFF